MKTHFQSILEGLGRYAIPILSDQHRAHSPLLIGTGTLFHIDSDVFLITARHVVDKLKNGLFVTTGNKGFIRFAAEKAAYEYSTGTGQDHDICIAKIPTEVIENLNENLRLVEFNQLSVIDPYDKLTLYAFVGYPHSKNKPKPKTLNKDIRMRPFYYVFREFLSINELPTRDKSEQLHVAFYAPFDEFKDIDLQQYLNPPDPHGISGCGVWKIILNKESGQIDQLALVAVGIEHLIKDNAFVATRIQSPLMAIIKFKQILQKGALESVPKNGELSDPLEI